MLAQHFSNLDLKFLYRLMKRAWHHLFTSVTTVSLTQTTQRGAAGWLMNWKQNWKKAVVFFSGGNEETHEKLGPDNASEWYSKLVPTKRNSESVYFRTIILWWPTLLVSKVLKRQKKLVTCKAGVLRRKEGDLNWHHTYRHVHTFLIHSPCWIISLSYCVVTS